MNLKLLPGPLLLTIFLHQNLRNNLKLAQKLSLETSHRVLICLLNLRPQMLHICGFLDCFSISYFLENFHCFQNLGQSSLNSNLDFIQNKLTFCVQIYQFVAGQQTSTGKLTEFVFKVEKTVHIPKGRETKITLRNTFIDNLFALESEKGSEIGRGILCQNLTSLLKFRPRMAHICDFLNCFSFSHFLVTYCWSQTLRLSLLNSHN